MDFGELIRLLLSINDIKMYNLAQALDYDKSYISKWVNHTKLPPSKEIDRLAEEIAAFVARESDSTRKNRTARELGFARKDGTAPEGSLFTEKLAGQVKEAYWQSKYQPEEREVPATSSRNRIPGKEFHRTRRMEETECVLTTQPISKSGEFQNALEDFGGLERNSRLKLQAVIDLERFGDNVDLYWKHICHLLSFGRDADVELLETGSCGDLPDRLLIAKDRFVVQTLQLPFSDQTVTIHTEDPAVVYLYYSDARRFLQRQQRILESSNTNGNLYYYKYASTHEKNRYLLSSMFPIYMDEHLFGDLLEKYGSTKLTYPREYLKEFRAQKSVVMFETALLRYMSTGKISVFDAYEGETLTKNERRRHLQGILDELEDGKRLEMRILSDKNPILNYDDISVSFFMNDNSAYCSDIRKKQDGVRYFMSSNSRKHLGAFMDHINALPEEYLTGQKKTIDYIYHGMKNL